MRTLIVYYSRSGKTKKMAEMLADRLNAKADEIRDGQDRHGLLGFLRSGKEALTGKAVELEPMRIDPAGFDLVIIASPIWAGTIASPVRSYVKEYGDKLRRVGFFCTMAASENERAAREIEKLLGRKLKVKAAFSPEDLKEGRISSRVEYFIASVFTLPDYC